MSFTPTAPPPVAAQNTCTPTQIQNIYNDCLAGGTCPEQDRGDPAFNCYNCIFTNESDPSWGPVVLSPEFIANINFGGCLTLLEPCNTACAATFEQDLLCEEAACGASCAQTEDAGNLNDYDQCVGAADSCDPNGCFQYWNGTGCQGELTGANHPGSACFATPTNFEQSFLTVAGIFCGG